MKPIKNIILDLGGVLLDIDYHKTSDAFKKLGVKDFDNFYSQYKANELFEDLETGKITENDFYATVQQHCAEGTSTSAMENAWNAMILSFRKESLAFLQSIKNEYNLYLLSNTNQIHYNSFSKLLTVETGFESLEMFFIKAYYSHAINRRKPYAETYQYVLQDANLIASETLFIDDSINNIEGAQSIGIQTHHLLPNEKIETLAYFTSSKSI